MWQGWIQIAFTLLIILGITPLFGRYIARIFLGESTLFDRFLDPVEQGAYRFIGVNTVEPMTGWEYLRAVFMSNLVMAIVVMLILFGQGALPLNPTDLGAPTWDTILHTAISFIVNADQQHYSGEITLSYFSQTVGLSFVFFTSAATGLSVSIAFIRGLTGNPLGNFYRDLVRSITRILLPISLVIAVIFVAAGVPETFAAPPIVPTLEDVNLQQTIALGPVAHFEAIKILGENGGGFFAINSAHPFENPNGLTNLIQIVAMVSIPASLIYAYGIMSHNLKQAWLIYGMVFGLYLVFIVITAFAEYGGNPLLNSLFDSPQPNLEGKEIRFGWAQSILYAVTTTATMCGAVNGMHDSFMPMGGFALLSNLFLQIIWGGQGTGTAYLYAYLILAVFVTGLMVGRTPEFLGRKIEQREVVLTSLLILLIHPIFILIPGAITLAFPDALAGVSNPGYHGLSQVIYEYASAAANNGSGFEGLADSQPASTGLWWNLSTSVSLLAGRYIPFIALILLADGMSKKQVMLHNTGTLRTDTGLFMGVTLGVILIMGALTFAPVLALGTIAEAFEIMN